MHKRAFFACLFFAAAVLAACEAPATQTSEPQASAAILRARVRCPARYELLVEIVSAPRRSAAEMGVANPAIV